MKNSTKKNFVPTNDAKYTQRRRRKCGRDRPFDAFFKTRALRERQQIEKREL